MKSFSFAKNFLIFIGIIVIGLVAFMVFGMRSCSSSSMEIPKLAESEKKAYLDYIRSHGAAPAEYVAAVFDDHDLVFMGDFSYYFNFGFKQNVQVMSGLLPAIHAKGVTVIGMEHVLAEDQTDLDAMLDAGEFPEETVRKILAKSPALLGFTEYGNFFKAIRDFNHALPRGAEPFRLIGLNMKINLTYIVPEEGEEDPEMWKKALDGKVQEEFIFNVIDREILVRNKKALVYLRNDYCLKDAPLGDRTAYYEKMGLAYSGTPAMLVRQKIGDRAFVILHHDIWIRSDTQSFALPADGVFDAVIRELPRPDVPVVIPVAGSPFAPLALIGKTSLKTESPIALGRLCDAYLLTGPLTGYRVTPLPESAINEANLPLALEVFPIAVKDDETVTPALFVEIINKQIEATNQIISNFPQ